MPDPDFIQTLATAFFLFPVAYDLPWESKIGLILVYVGLCIPFATFVLRGFFLTVPWEIQEAAKIEGASNFQILYKIMLPMAKAPLLLVFLIQFTWIWNDLLFGMVLSRSVGVRPITTVLTGMKDLYASMDGPTILTATVMASIPTLVIFLLLQRHFIRGLTLGSMGTYILFKRIISALSAFCTVRRRISLNRVFIPPSAMFLAIVSIWPCAVAT